MCQRITQSTAAFSCAWDLGLLYLGTMLGQQCRLDTASYLRQCYLAFVACSIFAWIDVPSWLRKRCRIEFWSRRAHESNRPCTQAGLPCDNAATACQDISSSSSLSDDTDEAPSKSSACSMRGSCRTLRRGNVLQEAVLSSQELFASNEDVANLTVRDITAIFRYVLEVNGKDFDRNSFTSSQSNQTNKALTSMDLAVLASRGSTVVLGEVSGPTNNPSGQMDALYLLAAVRIFADWRCARFVPDGYRRYAMSVSLGRRDLVQNIGKVEQAVHAWIEEAQSNSCTGSQDNGCCESDQLLVSPTLQQLLQHEVDSGVHKKLPSLTEASAGNGLLWMVRQLLYHTTMVHKSLQVPNAYPTTRVAVAAAYEQVYGSYHGWTTQQIFRRSLQGAPEFGEILALLEEDKEQQSPHDIPTRQYADSTFVQSRPTNNKTDHPTVINNLETPPEPVGNFMDHLGLEWSKAVAHFSRFNCHGLSDQKRPASGPLLLVDFDLGHKESNMPKRMDSDVSDNTEDLTASTSSESEEMYPISFLEQDFTDHCTELTDVLHGFQELIANLNMNDPNRC